MRKSGNLKERGKIGTEQTGVLDAQEKNLKKLFAKQLGVIIIQIVGVELNQGSVGYILTPGLSNEIRGFSFILPYVNINMWCSVIEKTSIFKTRGMSEDIQSNQSLTRLERWSEGCDELTILKLKTEIIDRINVDTLGGPNVSIKRIILVIVIVVRVILIGFDVFLLVLVCLFSSE